VMGDKAYACIPTLQRVAAAGVVVFTINYRLAPEAAFPANIVDCKRALLWVKAHCEEYHGDANNVFVAGESTGGYLAALLAASPQCARFQPADAPAADTSVAGAVVLYGMYDLVDEDQHMHRLSERVQWSSLVATEPPVTSFRQFLETVWLQVPFATHRATFELASPAHFVQQLELAGGDVCPFLVVHGTADANTPIKGARAFHEALQRVRAKHGSWAKGESDILVEATDAMHGFGYLPGLRAAVLADAVVAFVKHHAKRRRRA